MTDFTGVELTCSKSPTKTISSAVYKLGAWEKNSAGHCNTGFDSAAFFYTVKEAGVSFAKRVFLFVIGELNSRKKSLTTRGSSGSR